MPTGTETLEVRIIGSETVSPASKKVTNALGRVEKSSVKTTSQLKSLALGFVGVTAVLGSLTAGFNKTVKAATVFEKEFANVATLVDTTKTNMDALRTGILDMSVDVTKSTTDLTEGLYQVISAGVDSTEALDVLRVAAVAASAGVADTASSVKSITGILNAYGLETREAARISDLLFQTVKLGVTTFGELSGAIGTVIPTAAALGIELEDLFAAIATLTKANIDTRTATMSLRATFVSILKPTADAIKMAKQLKLDWSASALQAKGLVRFINDMKEATKGNIQQMAILIPEATALTAVLTLAGEQSETFNKTQGAMKDALGSTREAFVKQESTVDAHMKKLGLSIDRIGIKIGNQFLPSINNFLIGTLNLFDRVETEMGALDKTMGGISERVSKFDAALTAIQLAPLFLGISRDALTAKQALDIIFNGLSSSAKTTATSISDAFAKSPFAVTLAESGKVIQALKDIDLKTLAYGKSVGKIATTTKTKWGEVTESIKEAANLLGVATKGLVEEQVGTFTDAFSTIIGDQQLTQNEMITLRQSLFDKFGELASKEGAWLGIDQATLQAESEKLQDSLFAGLNQMVNEEGKIIDEANKAFEEKGNVTSVFIKSQTVDTQDFINETLAMINNAIDTATTNDINAFGARKEGVLDYTLYQEDAEISITEFTMDEWATRSQMVTNYADHAIAEYRRIVTAWQSTQAAMIPVANPGEFIGYTGQFHEGTPFVPQTGPYLLERGEAVIPVNQNPNNQDSRSYDQSVRQDITINVYGENPYEQGKALEQLIRLQGTR